MNDHEFDPENVQVDYAQYSDRLYRFALSLCGDRHQAEDLTQDTFLRAERSREQLKDPARLRSWLFQIAANLWKDRLRHQARRPAVPGLDFEVPSPQPGPMTHLIQQEREAEIFEAMGQLPPQQRAVLLLSVVEQMPPAEIATVLESPVNAVKVNLSHARRTLRERLFPESARPTKASLES